MFLKCCNGKFGLQGGIVQSKGTVARRCDNVRGVCFRVCEVVEGVLGGIPELSAMRPTTKKEHIPLDTLYTLRRQFKYEEPAISNQAIVCRRCHSNPIVEEGRVLNRVALKTLRVEFEHYEGEGWRPSTVMVSRATPGS